MRPRALAILSTVMVLANCSQRADPRQPLHRQTVPVVTSAAQSAQPLVPKEAAHISPERTVDSGYELAKDLAARKDDALREMGSGAQSRVIRGVFLFVTPQNRDTANALSFAEATLDAYANQRFDRFPERAITVLLYTEEASYHSYCKRRNDSPCSTPFGFYQGSTRTIVMNVSTGIGTLTHELVHPIIEADFPQAPDWINEGIASLFERPVLGKKAEIHGTTNWRLPILRQALRSVEAPKLASLAGLFGMSDEVFRGPRENVNYATARYVCQWLDEQDLLWPFYRAWRDHFENDPTGKNAFEQVVGTSVEQADVTWKKWLRTL